MQNFLFNWINGFRIQCKLGCTVKRKILLGLLPMIATNWLELISKSTFEIITLLWPINNIYKKYYPPRWDSLWQNKYIAAMAAQKVRKSDQFMGMITLRYLSHWYVRHINIAVIFQFFGNSDWLLITQSTVL